MEKSSQVQIGREKLTGVTEIDAESADDVEVLGNAVMFTIGDLIIPREWLVERMDELGIDSMTPNQRRVDSAYRAAARWLIRPENKRATLSNGREAEFSIKKGDAFLARHIVADVFQPAEEDGEEGSWDSLSLGVLHYENPDDRDAFVRNRAKISEDHELYSSWVALKDEFESLFETMQESHGGDSIHDLIYDWIVRNADVIKLRDAGAVYFVPARYSDTIEALSALCRDLNQFKERGRNIEMHSIPIVDDSQRREMIYQRAEIALRERLEDAIDEAVDMMVDEELSADDAVVEIEESLAAHGEFAERYNALLEVEMGVEELISEWKDSISGKRVEIVERILGESEDSGLERDDNGQFVSKSE